jgi:hypothetical protein
VTQGGRGFVLCSGLSTPWRDFLLRVQHAGFVSQALRLEGRCVEGGRIRLTVGRSPDWLKMKNRPARQ